MNKLTTSTAIPTRALKLEVVCLASGTEAVGEMMDRDAQAICGPRHARGRDRRAHRWGKTKRAALKAHPNKESHAVLARQAIAA
jgi:hypothetical protein